MNRRQVLAVTGLSLSPVALTGCIQENSATDNSNASSTDSVTDTMTTGEGDSETESADGFTRTVSIAEVDDLPEESPVEYEVAMTQRDVTSSGMAFFEITTMNIDDLPHRALPYYKGPSAWDGKVGIMVYELTAPDSPPEDYTPDCIDEPEPKYDTYSFTEEGHDPKLEAGESRTASYIVSDDPTHEGCFPPGEYRFDSKNIFDLAEGAKGGSEMPLPHTAEETLEFTWGFSLRIRDQ